MTKVVNEVVADLEEDKVMNQVDLDVIEVMDDQGLLVEVERCLEGTEEVTNPNDVGHDVDDDYHSFDGDVDVDLVLDALLSIDERLFLDVYLDDLLGLGADELQSPMLDDYLDLDDVYVVDVELVLLAFDVEDFDVVSLSSRGGWWYSRGSGRAALPVGIPRPRPPGLAAPLRLCWKKATLKTPKPAL